MQQVSLPTALVGVLIASLAAATASARQEVVTWSHESPCTVDSFLLRVGDAPGSYSEVIDVGLPRQAGAHFSYPLDLEDAEEVYVCVAARRAELVSDCSNELNLDPASAGHRPVGFQAPDLRSWCEDFDRGMAQEWVHTGPGSSLVQTPGVFHVQGVGEADYALSTGADLDDVHSHYVGRDSDLWNRYEYSGQLRFSQDESGIGVTLLSSYPAELGYYRLGRGEAQSFALTRTDRDPSFNCPVHEDVPAIPGDWFAFRVRIWDDGTATEVHSKVWPADEREPDDFQMKCRDLATSRRKTGGIGVWSSGPGQKWWDDLSVSRVPPDSDEDPLGIPGTPALAK